MNITVKCAIGLVVAAVVWLGFRSYHDRRTPEPAKPSGPLVSTEGHPMTQAEMAAQGHAEHPGNLRVTVRNTGEQEIRNVYMSAGDKQSSPCTLAPLGETDTIFYIYPFCKPLWLYYEDAAGGVHKRPFRDVYRLMPETIKGNFDLLLEVDGAVSDVVVTVEADLQKEVEEGFVLIKGTE